MWGRPPPRESFLARAAPCSVWDGGEGLARAKLRGLVLPDLRMAEDLGTGAGTRR